MTDEQVRKLLDEAVRKAGSQVAAAARLGISDAYLSDLRRGKRQPGPKVLAALGLARRDVYEKDGKR